MRPSLRILAVGCVLLPAAAQAQTIPNQPEAPPASTGEVLPSPDEASQLNSAPITPPPSLDQPGNPGSPNSNLVDMIVTRDGTEVRETPDATAQLLGHLDTGTQVLVIGSADGWSHVLVGGTDGFVHSDSLKK
jgi:hypothetical protein